MWLAKPDIFTLWPFKEEVCWLLLLKLFLVKYQFLLPPASQLVTKDLLLLFFFVKYTKNKLPRGKKYKPSICMPQIFIIRDNRHKTTKLLLRVSQNLFWVSTYLDVSQLPKVLLPNVSAEPHLNTPILVVSHLLENFGIYTIYSPLSWKNFCRPSIIHLCISGWICQNMLKI